MKFVGDVQLEETGTGEILVDDLLNISTSSSLSSPNEQNENRSMNIQSQGRPDARKRVVKRSGKEKQAQRMSSQETNSKTQSLIITKPLKGSHAKLQNQALFLTNDKNTCNKTNGEDIFELTAGFKRMKSPRSPTPNWNKWNTAFQDQWRPIGDNNDSECRSQHTTTVELPRRLPANLIPQTPDRQVDSTQTRGTSQRRSLRRPASAPVARLGISCTNAGNHTPFVVSGGGFGRSSKATPPPTIFTSVPILSGQSKSCKSEPTGRHLGLEDTLLLSPSTYSPSSECFSPITGIVSTKVSSDSAGALSLKRRRPGLKADLLIDTLSHATEITAPSARTPTGKTKLNSSTSQVLDFLYIGGLVDLSRNPRQIAEQGYSAFVNASRGELKRPPGSTELNLYLRDKSSEDVTCTMYCFLNYVEEARKANRKVLVFCHRGISRSASLVLGYLIWGKSMSYDEALAFLKERRPCIDPNVGFCLQLMQWSTCRIRLLKNQTFVYRIAYGDDRSYLVHEENGDKIDCRTRLAFLYGPINDELVQEKTSGSLDLPQRLNDASNLRTNFLLDGPGTDCWLVCSSSCQFIWFSPLEVEEQLVGDSFKIASQLVDLEGAPSSIVKIHHGSETTLFLEALSAAKAGIMCI